MMRPCPEETDSQPESWTELEENCNGKHTSQIFSVMIQFIRLQYNPSSEGKFKSKHRATKFPQYARITHVTIKAISFSVTRARQKQQKLPTHPNLRASLLRNSVNEYHCGCSPHLSEFPDPPSSSLSIILAAFFFLQYLRLKYSKYISPWNIVKIRNKDI